MMPVSHRQWFIRRIVKDKEKEKEIIENNSSSNQKQIDNSGFDQYEKMLNKKFR